MKQEVMHGVKGILKNRQKERRAPPSQVMPEFPPVNWRHMTQAFPIFSSNSKIVKNASSREALKSQFNSIQFNSCLSQHPFQEQI